MQCERCTKKKATVFYRENIGGRVKALRLCGDCAELLEQAEELEDMSIPLSGAPLPLILPDERIFRLPFRESPAMYAKGTGKKCSGCGMTYADMVSRGEVGCSGCYELFSSELYEVITALHGSAEHRGRVSAGYREKQERAARLETLRGKLKEAIQSEEYEVAASLRDEIRALEATL